MGSLNNKILEATDDLIAVVDSWNYESTTENLEDILQITNYIRSLVC